MFPAVRGPGGAPRGDCQEPRTGRPSLGKTVGHISAEQGGWTAGDCGDGQAWVRTAGDCGRLPGTERVMSHNVIMIRSEIYEINSSQYLWESIG